MFQPHAPPMFRPLFVITDIVAAQRRASSVQRRKGLQAKQCADVVGTGRLLSTREARPASVAIQPGWLEGKLSVLHKPIPFVDQLKFLLETRCLQSSLVLSTDA